MTNLTFRKSGSSPFVFRWGLSRILFPDIVRRASGLMPYAKKKSEMRDQADPDRQNMYSYIANAKGDDGDPAYKDVKEVFSEARGLIVGGELLVA